MKIKILVKLLIAFSLVFTTSISIIIACGGWDDYGYGYSDFAPEPNVDTTYTPLFYSSSEMFYGIWYDGGYIERFNDEILTDWQNFLKGKIDRNELSFLLFDEKSPAVVDDLHAYVSRNAKIGTYPEWASKIDLNTNEIKSFIEFLYLAKKVELSSKANYDYWDYENAVKPNPVDINSINQLKSKFENSKNNFLKNRYWFQVIKAYFYSDQHAQA